MQSKAATPDEYIAEIPEPRRTAIVAVRQVILDNLPEGYVEAMGWGVIVYKVPESVFTLENGATVSYAALANQVQYMSVYLNSRSTGENVDQWFREAHAAAGKKIYMGKGCVRFKKLDDLLLDRLAEAIKKVPIDTLVESVRQSRLKGEPQY